MSKEMNWMHLHDINTFSCSDNEVYLSGTDEEWLDIKYIKKQTIKYIKQL